MMVPDFIIRLIGRRIADKLRLQEGTKMDGTKPWYTSRTIWAVSVSGMIGIYMSLIQAGVHLPQIPAWVITLLSAVGVYTRSAATDKLTA